MDHVLVDKQERNMMRGVLLLHQFLENASPSSDWTCDRVSPESMRRVLCAQGIPCDNKSKEELWEQIGVLRDQRLEKRRHASHVHKEEEKEDTFGTTIENPVMGDDGIVYDRSSMEKWFEKKENGDYRWIPYTYINGVSVPVFQPVGGEVVLTRYFTPHDLGLETVINHDSLRQAYLLHAREGSQPCT